MTTFLSKMRNCALAVTLVLLGASQAYAIETGLQSKAGDPTPAATAENAAQPIIADLPPEPTPEQLQLAKAYLDAAPIEDEIRNAIENVAAGIQPDQRVLFKTMGEKHIDFARLRAAAEKAAAQTFTADELRALSNFFNSPEGKSSRLKMDQYQKLVQPVITEVLQQFIMRIQDASILQAQP